MEGYIHTGNVGPQGSVGIWGRKSAVPVAHIHVVQIFVTRCKGEGRGWAATGHDLQSGGPLP